MLQDDEGPPQLRVVQSTDERAFHSRRVGHGRDVFGHKVNVVIEFGEFRPSRPDEADHRRISDDRKKPQDR